MRQSKTVHCSKVCDTCIFILYIYMHIYIYVFIITQQFNNVIPHLGKRLFKFPALFAVSKITLPTYTSSFELIINLVLFKNFFAENFVSVLNE